MGDALCVPFFSFHEWKEKIAHLIFFLPFLDFPHLPKARGEQESFANFSFRKTNVLRHREREGERNVFAASGNERWKLETVKLSTRLN